MSTENTIETVKRTPKQMADVVYATISEILKAKRIAKSSLIKGERIDKEWFSTLITDTCTKHNINEGHIRKVGGWVVGAEVDESEVDED